MEGNQDIIGKYTGRVANRPISHEKAEYKAWHCSPGQTPEMRLSVRLRGSERHVIGYAHLIRFMCIREELVGLMCSDCTIKIKGERLGPLEELLHDQKVRYVQEFDPKQFGEPGPDDPIITKIEVKPLFEGNTDLAGNA